MNNYEMVLKFSELFKELSEVKKTLELVLSNVKPESDLWDNSDIIKYWKVSERTLADWRKKGAISFVQVQGKIWYPRSSREDFLKSHTILIKVNDHRIEYGHSNIMITKNERRTRS